MIIVNVIFINILIICFSISQSLHSNQTRFYI